MRVNIFKFINWYTVRYSCSQYHEVKVQFKKCVCFEYWLVLEFKQKYNASLKKTLRIFFYYLFSCRVSSMVNINFLSECHFSICFKYIIQHVRIHCCYCYFITHLFIKHTSLSDKTTLWRKHGRYSTVQLMYIFGCHDVMNFKRWFSTISLLVIWTRNSID